MRQRTKDKELIVVQNKIDSEKTQLLEVADIAISAKRAIHLEELEEHIFRAAHIPDLAENNILISNARHYDAFCRAHQSIGRVIQGMNTGLSGDILSEDLRQTLTILAEITGGQITTDEVLANIFSHFCVGK